MLTLPDRMPRVSANPSRYPDPDLHFLTSSHSVLWHEQVFYACWPQTCAGNRHAGSSEAEFGQLWTWLRAAADHLLDLFPATFCRERTSHIKHLIVGFDASYPFGSIYSRCPLPLTTAHIPSCHIRGWFSVTANATQP